MSATAEAVDAEHVSRLAATVCRESESVVHTVSNLLGAPLKVGDLLAFAEDPATLRADVPLAAARKAREAYDELVSLVGEAGEVWDCTWNVTALASSLAARVVAAEDAVAKFDCLTRRFKR